MHIADELSVLGILVEKNPIEKGDLAKPLEDRHETSPGLVDERWFLLSPRLNPNVVELLAARPRGFCLSSDGGSDLCLNLCLLGWKLRWGGRIVMQMRIDYSGQENVILAWVTGAISREDYAALIAALRLKAGTHACPRLLLEACNVSGQLSLLDLHELPDLNQKMPVPLQSGQKTALLHSAENSLTEFDQINYLCHRLNAEGYQIRLFTQREAASGWLKN